MKTKISLAILVLFTAFSTMAAPPAEEGKTIFQARCAACHNVNKQVVGPALAGVDQRRPIDWIVKFVHSSQTVVKSGDEYAVALFNKFNKIQMPDHPDLTEDNIKSIVEYIKAEASAAQEKTPAPPAAEPKMNLLTMILADTSLIFTFSVLILMLIASLIFAVKVRQMRRSKNL